MAVANCEIIPCCHFGENKTLPPDPGVGVSWAFKLSVGGCCHPVKQSYVG